MEVTFNIIKLKISVFHEAMATWSYFANVLESILCRKLREILEMEEYFLFTHSAVFRKLYTDKMEEYK